MNASDYADGSFYRINKVVNPFVVSFAKRRVCGVVVDFGCGAGTNLLYLKNLGWKVLGFDRERLAVDVARKRWEGAENDIRQMDIESVDAGQIPVYDLALCNYVMQHLSKEGAVRLLENLAQKARPSSNCILSVFLERDGIQKEEIDACMERGGWTLITQKEWRRYDDSHGIPHWHHGMETLWGRRKDF